MTTTTLTGNPLNFETESAQNASECILTMEPIQDGSGTPSPDNVRAISGRDSVEMVRCGKNLFDNISTIYNCHNCQNVNGEYYVTSDSVSQITINASSGSVGLMPVNLQANVEYYISFDVESATLEKVYVCTVYADDNGRKNFHIGTGVTYGSFTPAYDVAYIGLVIYGSFTTSSVIKNIQLEKGSTATDYEAYTAETKSYTLPSTVYGGTLDVNTGILTSTYTYIASYAGETINEPWVSSMDEYVEGATPTTGAEVCYTSSTPTTYQLTPAQVSLLLGTNNISTDADSIELTYSNGTYATLTDIQSSEVSILARLDILEAAVSALTS